MVIPSTAKMGNIIAQNVSFLDSWNFVDHDTGLPFCSFDSFGSFSMNASASVTQYPIEGGSFRYYNKDDSPTNIEITLIKSGLVIPGQKKKFINTLQQYVGQPKLVDISTTSGTYIGYTIQEMKFGNLPDDCADMLMVTLTITEVRTKKAMEAAKPKAKDRIKSAFQQLIGL